MLTKEAICYSKEEDVGGKACWKVRCNRDMRWATKCEQYDRTVITTNETRKMSRIL